MNLVREFKTDVLVIGGGLAGCWAAIAARESGSDVILVDKGPVGKTGKSKFASGDIKCFMEGDDLPSWIEEIVTGGDYLADQRWLETVLTQTYPRVKDMESYGVKFEKEDRSFKREYGRGKITKQVVFNAPQMMAAMRAKLESLGVKILDRVFVYKLFGSDGSIKGAFGIHTRDEESYLLTTKAVIMAAGGCAFQSIYYGSQFATGDSYALAYDLGAELTNFEFVSWNTCSKDMPTAGMSRFVAYGGVFRNSLGEAFMARYEPVKKDRTQLTNLVIALAREVRERRGPIFFDVTSISPENYELSRRIIPWNFMLLDKAGVDIRKQRMEWVPALVGLGGNSCGIKTDFEYKAAIDGLYACGDAWASVLNGAGMGFGGLNLALCCVSGFDAGKNAAKWARHNQFLVHDPSEVEQSQFELRQVMSKTKGYQPNELLYQLQAILIPYEVLILRHGDRLVAALERLHELSQRAQELYAANRHQLIKVLELRNMLLVAEMVLKCANMRTESRGAHFREDYPSKDNKKWLKWVALKKLNTEMQLWAEPIPEEAFKYVQPA